MRDEITERHDLSFIVEENDVEMFPPSEPIEENSQRFARELRAYDMMMVGIPLFTNAAEQEITQNWRQQRAEQG